MDDHEELMIPPLPNHLALECLIRLPHDSFTAASNVSKSWKAEINLTEFRRRRKESGLARFLMVLVQAWCQSLSYAKSWSPPLFRLTLYDPQSNNWSDLPPLPWFPAGLPLICRIVAVGSDLLVLGGCDPFTGQVCNSVFIYSFVLGSWRIGSDMPGHQRMFFACASDSDRKVYVAGGHDEDKRALRSALVYDMAEDTWSELPDMARDRDECHGVFRAGRFEVVGGFSTNRQGEFGRDMEAFDVGKGKWSDVVNNFLDGTVSPANCIGDCDVDGRMYIFGKGNLKGSDDVGWEILAGFPDDVSSVSYATAWRGRRLMIGYEERSGTHNVYIMESGDDKWTKMDSSLYYKGLSQSVCSLYL